MLAALTFAFCALSSAAPAFGDPPIVPPPNPDANYPAGQVCPFPLRVTTEIDNSLLHIQRNGDLIVTGKLVKTAMNLRTGKSVTITANGPLRVVFHNDGTATLISHGAILWTFFAQDVGGPGLFLFTGRVVIEVDANGLATSVSRVEKLTDICEALA
jgi:hypothetical protein